MKAQNNRIKSLLDNIMGYTGEVTAKFIITDAREFLQNDGGYHSGDRICQMIILPYPEIEFEEAEELTETDRGTCGYGSTGR